MLARKAPPQGLVDHLGERLTPLVRRVAQLFEQIVVDGDGSTHGGIMMRIQDDVKMPAALTLR